MPRVSRQSVNSQYYHVMVQGIDKEKIFKKDTMKIRYIALLTNKSKLNNILIISYCIMPNHAHILIKAEKTEQLSKMMSQINSSYGKFYNKSENRVGYVFRDRYRAEPIHTLHHLHNCVRYIHQNPVKAEIVANCEEYVYSSYKDYKNNIIDKTIIFEIYGETEDILTKISGEYNDYNFIDVDNEFGNQKFEDFNKVCKEYDGTDFRDEKNVYKISKELKKRCNVSNNEIIKFMNLKRATYYNIMKRQKKKLDF